MFLTQSVLADEYGEDMEKAKKLEKKFIEVLNDYKVLQRSLLPVHVYGVTRKRLSK